MAYTFGQGNVLISRVENVQQLGNSLGRVWIDEYSWNATSAPVLGRGATTRVQSMYFPYQSKDKSTVVWQEVNLLTNTFTLSTQVLTLPIDDTNINSRIAGQLTLSQDQCAFSIAGFNVGMDEIGTTPLWDGSGAVNPSVTAYAASGYPMSIARQSRKGWRDAPKTWYTNTFVHWLPYGSVQVRLVDTAGNTVTRNYWSVQQNITKREEIPRGVVLTSQLEVAYGGRVYYFNGAAAPALSTDFALGATFGRCFYGQRTDVLDASDPEFSCTYSSGFVTVDPTNADGSQGFCYVGTQGSSTQRLLQVRRTLIGSVFSWPESRRSADPEKTYTPSLLNIPAYVFPTTTAYSKTPATVGSVTWPEYWPKSISILADGAETNMNAGVAYTGNPANLRNCAGRIDRDPPVAENPSWIWWAEATAGDGYAVAASLFGAWGFFRKPVPIWQGGVFPDMGGGQTQTVPAGTQTGWVDVFQVGSPNYQSVVDNNVIGVTFNAEFARLFAATPTALYATANPRAIGVVPSPVYDGWQFPVRWYQMMELGQGQLSQDYFTNSKIRGLVPVPRACIFTNNAFRRALGDADAEQGDESLAVEAEHLLG